MTDILMLTWITVYAVVSGCYAWEVLSRSLPLPCPERVRTFVAETWHGIPFLMLADLAVRAWNEPVTDRLLDYALKGILLACWLLMPPPDDRWKRRRKRLAAKIRRRHGRLVVTPEGAR